MDCYEKVYFQDDYAKQLEELRSRYHERTQNALKGRKIDKSPMPNATTVVYLHDDPDGGICITTGDFVEYFNRHFGSKDRIGAVRESLEKARRRSERETQADRAVREARLAPSKKGALSNAVRTANHRFSLLQAVFAMMLMLSITMLFCTSLVLRDTNENISTLESEIAVLESERSAEWLSEEYNTASVCEDVCYPAMDGEDQVEIYAPEEHESGIVAFFHALASLAR